MKKRINNKGFTLIELLAALVILTAIMAIAIPSISSSLERSKTKQDAAKKKILISAAELYVTDHKNAIYKKLEESNTSSCYIALNLLDVSEENLTDQDGNDFNGRIVFTKPNDYKYEENSSVTNSCL